MAQIRKEQERLDIPVQTKLDRDEAAAIQTKLDMIISMLATLSASR